MEEASARVRIRARRADVLTCAGTPIILRNPVWLIDGSPPIQNES